MEVKDQLRIKIKGELKKLSPKFREKEEDETAAKVQRLPQLKDADLILGYLSFGEEFSIDNLLQWSLSTGKKIAVPKVMDNRLEFIFVDDLQPSHFDIIGGIREPERYNGQKMKGKDVVDLNQYKSPLMLVPGLGFSVAGERLGRGGGFYDRYLAQYSPSIYNLYTVGVCFSCQIKSFIPMNSYDRLVDQVLFSSS